MKKVFFTVGPSQLYPTVYGHIDEALKENIPSISHRSEKFMDIYQNTTVLVKKVLSIPSSFHVFFTASSLESMERILQNCVYRHSFHLVNGAFSKTFYKFALQLGLKPEKIEAPFGQGFDFDKIKIPKEAELICITHNETSTGVSLPMNKIYQLRSCYPNKLIALDIVSSAPYEKIDFSKIDIAFFSLQKGFGLPAGLGVLIVSDKAVTRASKVADRKSTGSYHSFSSYLEYEKKSQTPETPNVLAVYLLGKVASDMLKKGIKTIREETVEKADHIYKFFDQHNRFRPFIKDKDFRSKTTIVVDVGNKSKQVRKKLQNKGLVVGSGYGDYKDSHIRIANFPAHQLDDIKRLLKQF